MLLLLLVEILYWLLMIVFCGVGFALALLFVVTLVQSIKKKKGKKDGK